jgi:hypothetical protein
VGYLPPGEPFLYGRDYFSNYAAMADTEIAVALNTVRVQMLRRHTKAQDVVVDVGIGAGTFMDAAGPQVHGYDVNPVGIAWLHARMRFFDPYSRQCDVACFWDALEHIENPSGILCNVRRIVLVSLPIFRDATHARTSKHYKPGEHIWYFTDGGIHWFMQQHGYARIERHVQETDCGREDIVSYAFRRVA